MKIEFDKSYEVDQKEVTLFDLYRAEDLPLVFGCRIGICGVCKIRVTEGLENVSKKNKAEKEFTEKNNERLACQCIIRGDVKIECCKRTD